MNEVSDWKISKWPFLAANAALIAAAIAIACKAPQPVTHIEIYICIGCVALGALLGCLPFILEYRATCKLLDVNAVTTVVAQLHDLKTYSSQVAVATEQWARIQETTKDSGEKTAAAAREIAERMAVEVRQFAEFQQKMNDTERTALRLEVEKLRRSEEEWLQILVRIMDHIHALHTAATRSGQPELATQIGSFQNACRGVVRRVGLVMFGVEAGEKFDAQKHRAHGVENPPADAAVAETLAPGITFQSRLVRPALIRLRAPGDPVIAEVKTPLPLEAE
ncbi:MAG TPA: nucleotide exchange factor GrpE [Verrucomicrobiae bacterium]